MSKTCGLQRFFIVGDVLAAGSVARRSGPRLGGVFSAEGSRYDARGRCRAWPVTPAVLRSVTSSAWEKGGEASAGSTEIRDAVSNGVGHTFCIPDAATRSPPPLPQTRRARVCRRCKGTQLVACSDCKGVVHSEGRLNSHLAVSGGPLFICQGGYHKRNQINLSKLTGSKWTTPERTMGYNYFTVGQRRKEGKDHYALLVAAGDTSQQMWINVKNLKDRGRWAAGWLQREELLAEKGCQCRACSGEGKAPCPLCKPRGVEDVEVKL